MSDLQSADSLAGESNSSGKEQVSLGYLNGIWRDRGTTKAYAPSVSNLLLALELQTESIRNSTSEGSGREQKLNDGIEEIFHQTKLRRFEFLYIVSCAINKCYLERELFDVSPFRNHLDTFEKHWKRVLMHSTDTRLYDSRILHVKGIDFAK